MAAAAAAREQSSSLFFSFAHLFLSLNQPPPPPPTAKKTEMVQGKDEGEGQQPGPLRQGTNEELALELAANAEARRGRETSSIKITHLFQPRALSLPLHPPHQTEPKTVQATYDKLIQEVPKYKMITPSILSDRLRINGSLARAAIRHLVDEGAIRPIVESHHQYIYTRATNA